MEGQHRQLRVEVEGRHRQLELVAVEGRHRQLELVAVEGHHHCLSRHLHILVRWALPFTVYTAY